MLLALNKLCIRLSSKTISIQDNIRNGQSFAFVDRIYKNEIFGEVIYKDIFHQAAAYMFYIIKNHTFNDGNKRTGLSAAITFLEWNNIQFIPFEEEKVFEFVIETAQGPNDPESVIPKIASWLKGMSLY